MFSCEQVGPRAVIAAEMPVYRIQFIVVPVFGGVGDIFCFCNFCAGAGPGVASAYWRFLRNGHVGGGRGKSQR